MPYKLVFESITNQDLGQNWAGTKWVICHFPSPRISLRNEKSPGSLLLLLHMLECWKMLGWPHCPCLESVWGGFCLESWENVTLNSPLYLRTLPSPPHWVWGEGEAEGKRFWVLRMLWIWLFVQTPISVEEKELALFLQQEWVNESLNRWMQHPLCHQLPECLKRMDDSLNNRSNKWHVIHSWETQLIVVCGLVIAKGHLTHLSLERHSLRYMLPITFTPSSSHHLYINSGFQETARQCFWAS